jgi:hypothetical protein
MGNSLYLILPLACSLCFWLGQKEEARIWRRNSKVAQRKESGGSLYKVITEEQYDLIFNKLWGPNND